MTPDADQQAVIDIDHGRRLVLAPPGCGKTYILSERVIRAHNHGVAYDDMVCLTFTNRASRGMRDRIASRTGNPVPPDLFVGNVHRFCSFYLFNQKKIPQNSAIIDDLDSESIIAYLARLNPHEDHSRFTQEIVNLQHALSQRDAGLPREIIVHADLLGSVEKPEMKYKVDLARQYAEYKETDNLLDFEDLLEKCYLYAREEREALHRYRWIQIDEVQDLNGLQFAIVELFATPNATIVYLGDEQQAIFSFVGAKLEALESLKQKCSPNLHHLGRNHRSPKYLLELYNTYAARQLDIDPELLPTTDDNTTAAPQDRCLFRACHHRLEGASHKELLHCPYDGSSCSRCTRPNADEYRLAVQLAYRYAALDPEGRVAIIVPTNADADLLSREFGDTPHFKVSGRDLFSSPTVQLLFSHLNVVANETCFIAWARLLHLLQILPEYATARNFMRELRSRAISPTDLLMYDGSTYLQQFARTLDSEETVLFDTETTGLNVFDDDIIQIAAIKVRNGKYVEGSDFDIILETDKEIPPIVGGHDNPMLSVYLNSERFDRTEGLRRFLAYCGDHPLVGHNVEFDYHILDHNLQRTLGQELGQRRRFDTLKLIRLVEPRLRAYKLERLLETLHLEGENSHNAIDDVRATLSLLTYCRRKADEYIGAQRSLLSTEEVRRTTTKFRSLYRNLFLHSHNRLYQLPAPNEKIPVIVDELEYTYHQLQTLQAADRIEKWPHIIHFLTQLTRTPEGEKTPALRQMLDQHLVELNTLREADLCDNLTSALGERFFIATAHKAKGLEFDSVIVFNVTEGSYPYFFNLQSGNQERIREDARRFYVALSRAKKHLCITLADMRGHNMPAIPSPFLKPIASLLTRYTFNSATGRLTAEEQ